MGEEIEALRKLIRGGAFSGPTQVISRNGVRKSVTSLGLASYRMTTLSPSLQSQTIRA